MAKHKQTRVEIPQQPELITPALAAHWLEMVPDFQRKLLPRQVDKIAMAINSGEWRLNGATIVFNAKNELIDGQHRLAAIVKAGKAVQSLVIRGVSPDKETFHTIGDEAARKLMDFIRGTKYASNTASVMTMLWQIQQGSWPFGHGPRKVNKAPIADVLKVGEKYIPDIVAIVEPVEAAGRIVRQPSFLAFMVFYYTHIEPIAEIERLAKFVARVGDGVNLEMNDPAYRLRQKYLQLGPGDVIDRTVGQAFIVKALHFYLDHLPCGKLQFSIEREPFPELRKKEDWKKPQKERAAIDEERANAREQQQATT